MTLKEWAVVWALKSFDGRHPVRKKIAEWAIAYKIAKFIKGEIKMQPKSIWQSKTFWFNLLSAAVAIAGVYAAPQSGLPPKWAGIFGSVVTVGNILLRMVTSQPITAGSNSVPPFAVLLLALVLSFSGCSLMPKANQIKGLQAASRAIGAVQALDCDGIKAALTPVYPEVAALDCGAMKVVLAASKALVDQQAAAQQK